MKKNILISILLLLAFSVMPVLAAEEIKYNQDGTKIILSGITEPSLQPKSVTVIITRKGVDLTKEDFVNSESKTKLELAETVETDSVGKWTVEWHPSAVAYYTINATEHSGGTEFEAKEIYYVNPSDKINVDNMLLGGTCSQLETLFADRTTLSILRVDEEEINKITNTSKVGRALWYIRRDMGNVTDVQDMYDKIELAMDMVMFNEAVTDFDAFNTTMSTYGTITNLGIYNESVSDIKNATVLNISKGILECGLTGYDNLFTESLAFAGIEKSTNYAYLGNYLALLNDPVYNNADKSGKEKIQLGLIGKKYDSSTISQAITEALNGNTTVLIPSYNGGFGGGGGGGGSLGGVSGLGTGGSSGVNGVIQNTEPGFSDVPESHWAFASISGLKDRKIINGAEEGLYKPENHLTRAEAVTILCRAFDIPEVSDKQIFDDVDSGLWFAPFVNGAAEAGLVFGDGSLFNPDDYITRQDLCVMIYRFSKNEAVSSGVAFTDAESISPYASSAVASMSGEGIINGLPDGSFNPLGNATRAQAAQMIYKFLIKKVW